MEARLTQIALVALVALALAGCDAPAPPAPPEPRPAAAPAVAAPVAARELLIRERSADLDFGWRLVPDVSAFPALLAELRREAEAALAEARKAAADDRAARPADAPFFGHYFQQNWRVEADTPRLLSLAAETDSYSGGAHGMHSTRSLIWDKQAGRRLALPELFADWPAARAVIEPAYCAALDRERAERRGGEVGGSFNDCPPIAEQAVTLRGWGENPAGGLRVYLDPYTAGPYAEGSYELWLFTEPAVTSLLKPEYRPTR
jgi:hypothetical protein